MQHNFNNKDEDLQCVVITTLLYAFECWTLLATDLTKLEVFQMSCLRRILRVGLTRRDQLRNDTIRHRCMEQPTVEKRVQ